MAQITSTDRRESPTTKPAMPFNKFDLIGGAVLIVAVCAFCAAIVGVTVWWLYA
jgi:hypothetical protein